MNDDIIFNHNKFEAMVHYIVSKSDAGMNKLLLSGILYFSDFNYYEKYEKPISGETYTRENMMIVPLHFSDTLNKFIEQNKIDENTNRVINYVNCTYTSLIKPEYGVLSCDELQVIDDVIELLSNFQSCEIGRYVHGDIAWRLAEDGEALNYESVFYRDPEYSLRHYLQ